MKYVVAVFWNQMIVACYGPFDTRQEAEQFIGKQEHDRYNVLTGTVVELRPVK